MRAIVLAAMLVPAVAHADARSCEGDACDVDQGETPWIWRFPCEDTSDVVGLRRCRSFGEWSHGDDGPGLVLAAGVGKRHIVGPTDGALARSTTGANEIDLATTAFRLLAEQHGLRAGVELEVGDVAQRDYAYGDFLQSGGILGMGGRLWRLEIGGEMMFGARNLRTHVSADQPTGASVTSAVIEARIDVGCWITPWLALTGDVGAGLLERAEWVAALALAFHVHAFGG